MANIRIEAERMALTGYTVEKSSPSSGGSVINVGKGSGTATTRFSGATGTYDLKVAYHDENDGKSSLAVRVDGVTVASWRLDEATSSGIATSGNLRKRLISGVALNANSVVEIVGAYDGKEFSRVDYLDIVTSQSTSQSSGQFSGQSANPPSVSASSGSADSQVDVGSTIGIGRLEAEKMSLSGYTVENSGSSSGKQVINVGQGSGTAATKFTGVSGSYNLKVAYYDENDGQSSLLVKVDGRVVDSWRLDESTNSAIANPGNRRFRTISGLSLNTDSVIEVQGTYDGKEFSRVDYIELAANGSGSSGANSGGDSGNQSPVTPPPSSPNVGSTIGVGRLEAEKMTLSGGYTIENSSPSSGGKVINVGKGSGTAATQFVGAAGTYGLKVAYHDENDGKSLLSVKVDGQVVDSWRLDDSAGGAIATAGNLRERTLTGLSLNSNSVIEVLGTYDGKEFSRVDYIEVVSGGTTSSGGNSGGSGGSSGGGTANVGSTAGVGRIEAEKMTLTGGYTVENSSPSSGKKVINVGQGSGTAATKFVGSSGSYDLRVAYHDENDGKSSLLVKVDGQVVDSWILDDSAGGAIATTGNLRERVISGLSLNTNSVIEVQGTYDGKEFSRVDYLDIVSAGSGGGNNPSTGGSKKLKVLPLGDSNTKGEGTPGGYRIKFWERAVQDGVAIDFLGTRNNGPSRLGDGDHQGQGGWSIPQMTSWVRAGNLAAQAPDVILFMMGTNDANTNGAVKGASIRDRLATLIDEVAKAAPKAHLFVSSIPPVDTPKGTSTEAQVVKDFNNLIPALVQQKASQGKKVSYINAGGSLNVGDINGDRSATNDVNDGLHPTASGYDKLGNAWYNGVIRSSAWQNAVSKLGQLGQSASSVASDSKTSTKVGDAQDNLIAGGIGSDTLTGGGGADTFLYKNASYGLDVITDFSGNDRLEVSASGFGGGLVAGRDLDSSSFITGSNPTANSGGGTFLFNTASQTLIFDADGTGNGGALGIAKFSNGFNLQANQIDVFA